MASRRLKVEIVDRNNSWGKAMAHASTNFRGAAGWPRPQHRRTDSLLYAVWLVPLIVGPLLFHGTPGWKWLVFGLVYGLCSSRASRRKARALTRR